MDEAPFQYWHNVPVVRDQPVPTQASMVFRQSGLYQVKVTLSGVFNGTEGQFRVEKSTLHVTQGKAAVPTDTFPRLGPIILGYLPWLGHRWIRIAENCMFDKKSLAVLNVESQKNILVKCLKLTCQFVIISILFASEHWFFFVQLFTN